MVNKICSGGIILLTAIAMLLTQTAAARSTVHAQRQAIGINESFQVVFSTDQDLSNPPDFGPLELDFYILSQSKSSNISYVNGLTKSSMDWVLDLIAKRDGVFIIPPIVMGNDQTAAIEITVAANTRKVSGQAAAEVDLEIDIDNLSPYVQQQFIITLRLVHTIQLANASLTELTVTGGNVIIEKLGEDVAYETTRGQSRVGVLERRYALFAQSSEPIVIEPLRFEGRVAGNRRQGFDPFGRGRVVRKQSKAVEINVLPVPADFIGSTWLPVRQLMLVENSPAGATKYRVGEPFTRTLTLQATGLSASQLPQIDVTVPEGIKQYPDQPTLENRVGTDGLVAIRQEKVALIPSQPGRVTMPAIEIPWWNTQTGQQEYARLPARTVEVLPGVLPTDNATTAKSATAMSSDAAESVATATMPRLFQSGGIWLWISLVLGIGWLVTVLVWFWFRRQHRDANPVRTAKPRIKPLVAAIKRACDENDAAACKEALLNWAKLLWSDGSIRSLGVLAAMLDGELQAQVHALSQVLYRHADSGWNGQQFWQAFAAFQEWPQAAALPSAPELEPLYR
jgi:hypothetical protein